MKNMYQKPFYITENAGNNAFSYEKRQNKQIFVTSLVKANNFDEIELGNEIVFEDFDENGNLNSCKGLKNFYEFDLDFGGKSKKIYLFDNHNHAYYFWHKSRFNGIISENGNLLIHIDEHSDLRKPEKYLQKDDLNSLEKIANYTNYALNVGNYIIPAEKDGLVKKIVQIRSESELEDGKLLYKKLEQGGNFGENKGIILNIDLDFFEPNLDYIDFELKKEVILGFVNIANVITIASSPFFIEQKLAVNVLKRVFSLLF